MFTLLRHPNSAGDGGPAPSEAPAPSAAPAGDGVPTDAPESVKPDSSAEQVSDDPKVLRGQLDVLTKKTREYESKLGKQGNELGNLRQQADLSKQIAKAMREDPRGFLQKAASAAGIDFEVKDRSIPGFDLSELFKDDPALAAKGQEIQKVLNGQLTNLKSGIDTVVRAIAGIKEEKLSQKYATWDSDADTRTAVVQLMQAGQITPGEVAQNVILAQRMPDIIAKAQSEAVEKYKADLARKHQEQIEYGGAGSDTGKRTEAPDITEVGKKLRNVR